MTGETRLPGNGDRNEETPPELRRLLDRWPERRARPEFERALRDRFLAQEAVPDEDEDGDAHAPPARRPRALPPAPRRLPWAQIATVAAVAAAILLFWFRPTGKHATWHLLDPGSEATILVDGVRFAQTDAAGLRAALAVAKTLRTGKHEFAARFGELFALHLAPNSTVQVLAAPGHDERLRFATMDAGSGLSLATGPAFAGTELVVETPDADVHVVGTAFSIHPLGDAGTCVCCTHGRVAVHRRAPGAEPCGEVDRGGARVFQEGSTVYEGEAMAAHVAALERLRAAWDG